MQKAEIAEEIQKRVGLTAKREAVEALEALLVLLKSILQRGENVSIAGFGTFMVRSKRARQGRNPHTGEAMTIAARRVVTFRPSALFKAYVNGDSMPGQEPVEPMSLPSRSTLVYRVRGACPIISDIVTSIISVKNQDTADVASYLTRIKYRSWLWVADLESLVSRPAWQRLSQRPNPEP